jgi:hypothetical protein
MSNYCNFMNLHNDIIDNILSFKLNPYLGINVINIVPHIQDNSLYYEFYCQGPPFHYNSFRNYWLGILGDFPHNPIPVFYFI